MEPKTALENLDRAVSVMNLNRENHTGLQQSVQVLNRVINEHEVLKKEVELLKGTSGT